MSSLTTDEYSVYLLLHAGGGPPYRARAELAAARASAVQRFACAGAHVHRCMRGNTRPQDDRDGAQACNVRDGAQLDAVDGKG